MGQEWLDVGGPDRLSHRELAEMAFAALGKPPKITFLPDGFRKLCLALVSYLAPNHLRGPAEFFLTAMGMDMIGEPFGDHHIKDHFDALALTIQKHQDPD